MMLSTTSIFGTIIFSAACLFAQALIAVETVHHRELHGVNGFARGFGTGIDMWRVFGPLDLAGVDGWGGEIHDLRIRFQMDYPDPMPIELDPILIRLGWVKLTEGAI